MKDRFEVGGFTFQRDKDGRRVQISGMTGDVLIPLSFLADALEFFREEEPPPKNTHVPKVTVAKVAPPKPPPKKVQPVGLPPNRPKPPPKLKWKPRKEKYEKTLPKKSWNNDAT